MKRLIAAFVLVLTMAGLSHAGTPQENGGGPILQAGPYSGATILTSSASANSSGNLTLAVATPTVINSGGGSYTGRNCFTKFVIQVSTVAVVTIKDNNTTVWTIYGSALGTTGSNTLTLPEDHLGPFCTAANDQTQFVITNTAGLSVNPQAIDVEGYTTYGSTLNQGPLN